MEAHTSVCESRVCDKKMMVAGFERGCDWEGHYLDLPEHPCKMNDGGAFRLATELAHEINCMVFKSEIRFPGDINSAQTPGFAM
jgi:hypothetical protein